MSEHQEVNVLVLVTDAYGARGGIAQHNRHLLDATDWDTERMGPFCPGGGK